MHKSKKLTINDKVLLCDGDHLKLVALKDVRFFETCGNYSKTYFSGGKLLIHKTLSYLESRLPDQMFFRANRQYIINVWHVEDICSSDSTVFKIEMSCGKQVELSRRRTQLFKSRMSI